MGKTNQEEAEARGRGWLADEEARTGGRDGELGWWEGSGPTE